MAIPARIVAKLQNETIILPYFFGFWEFLYQVMPGFRLFREWKNESRSGNVMP
jgi:hypothetical protein